MPTIPPPPSTPVDPAQLGRGLVVLARAWPAAALLNGRICLPALDATDTNDATAAIATLGKLVSSEDARKMLVVTLGDVDAENGLADAFAAFVDATSAASELPSESEFEAATYSAFRVYIERVRTAARMRIAP